MTHHTGATDERDAATLTKNPAVVPVDFRNVVNNLDEENQDEISEYVVDIDTHYALLVRATTPETAVAKAVLHTIDPEEDGTVTEVSRDVHTCVHTGIEGCEHEEHEEHEGAE